MCCQDFKVFQLRYGLKYLFWARILNYNFMLFFVCYLFVELTKMYYYQNISHHHLMFYLEDVNVSFLWPKKHNRANDSSSSFLNNSGHRIIKWQNISI